MSQLPTRCVGGVTDPQIAWAARELRPLPTPVNKGHPLLNPPPRTQYLEQRASEKPSTFLAIFMGLSLTPITYI